MAFSKDNGLPASKYFAHISPRFRVPLRSLFLVATVCCLLSLVNLGSRSWLQHIRSSRFDIQLTRCAGTTAFNALLSLPTVGFYLSYFPPICFITLAKLRGRPAVQYGPFRLWKRTGIAINLVSLVYIMYILSFVALPTILPVTRTNMNYAGPIVLAIILVAIVDWSVNGRKRFHLPETLILA